jgi:hypothetical protein
MKNILHFQLLVLTLLLVSGFSADTNKETELTGVWVRKSDHLKIKVTEESPLQQQGFIIDEGKEKFPCDVSAFPIYKNISRIKENLWSCDFLVVTMGSCATAYEEGIIRLTKENEMEITCPGFDKKLYSKLKPRYEL